ncbi:MAG: nucleotide exchange factor GrpE [Succinivibrionaceae bacterium]
MSNENENMQGTDIESVNLENQESESIQEKKENATEDSSKVLKELEQMTLKVKQLEDEMNKAKEDYLRGQAEIQNMRRRCEQEVDKAKKYAIDRFVKDLLPSIDPIEKALQFADRENEACKNLVQGVESTFSLIVKALSNNGVEVIDPSNNEMFDPVVHQAIQHLENPEVPANHVMTVIQKGYQLSGRVIRPALVIVSKGSAEQVVDASV